jgi:hypothetical protein
MTKDGINAEISENGLMDIILYFSFFLVILWDAFP